MMQDVQEVCGTLKLNNPCCICKKTIILGQNLVWKKGYVVHLECYLKTCIFEKLEDLEFAEYNDADKRIDFLKDF